ncbi:hypothetical protein [Actinoplanes sp. NPDC048796]|uniref:hypothetical protein n=1 Tax=Actinoplanes sp. NPDC048796 TaxID=3155640 RepID=UPI0033FA7A89
MEITVGGWHVRFQAIEPIFRSEPGATVLDAAAVSYAAGEETRPYPYGKDSPHAMLTCRRAGSCGRHSADHPS